MTRRWLPAMVISVLVAASLFGCVQAVVPDQPIAAATQLPAKQAKESWENEWDKTLAEAKNEGTVVIASSMGPQERQALQKGLADKYGINLEVTAARPAQFIPKIQAERRAGIYSTDALVAGISTVMTTLAPDGDLESLDPFLILPEVKNEKLWFEGRLRFVDKGHNLLGMVAVPKRPIALNRDLVKPTEIQSYRDLLDPKWKGKIEFSDPTIGGGGNATFQAIGEYIMDLEYLKQLGNQQLILVRDDRQMVEWVARAKYPVLIGYSEVYVSEFVAAGAPIFVTTPKEGTYATISGFGLSVLKNAPHPAATRVFINWILSKEGQTVLSQAAMVPSLRLDVSKDHLAPDARINPEEKFYWPDLDPNIAEKREQYRKIAMEIWGYLLK